MEPIRILHVVTYMGRGGLETMLMNYYRHVDRTKIQFDFLVHRDFEADYDKEIMSLGGKIYRLSPLNPFSHHYLKQLDSFFKNHSEYKVVHVHQDCLSSIILKKAYKYHVPIRIAHSHNANQDKNIKFLIKKHYMQYIPKYATHLFACSQEAGNWMFKGYPYTVINNAIDTKEFIYNEQKSRLMKKKLNISNDLVIGHVGRFYPQKNHTFLIDIFNEIHQLYPSSKLLLVGIGDLEKEIKDKVEYLHLSGSVIFLGNRDDVNDTMQAMDIFVFPSLYEGLPVTLIEAQASGLPIVKSNQVPDQCMITPNIYTLSLDDTAKQWATFILNKYKDYQRNNTYSYIKESGFDINENAKQLQDFYISEVNKYE